MEAKVDTIYPVAAAQKNMSVHFTDVERADLPAIFGATETKIVSLKDALNDPGYNGFNSVRRTGRIIEKSGAMRDLTPEEGIVTIVSDRYHLTQHKEVFDNVLKVLDEHNVNFSIPKLYIDQRPGRNRAYGNVVFDDVRVNVDGSDIAPTIDIFNSTDGSLPAGILFGAYRFKCLNGMLVGVKFNMQKMIHTPSIVTKLNFEETYEKVMVEFNELTQSIYRMQEVKFNDTMLETLKLMGFNKAFIKHYPVIVEKYLLNNSEDVKQDTLWALYSTATNYISNYIMLKNYSEAIKSQKLLHRFMNSQLRMVA